MKKILLAITACLALLPLATAQLPTGLLQTQTFGFVAAPANTPLLSSGSLFCIGSAGSFSAGTLVVAYTYIDAQGNESKASTDGGSTLTTLVTCPASGTLTIPSPPPAVGTFNVVGWRPYAIASSSGTGAELLQTITSANCPLSTASTTSCAMGSSFTETSLGAGAAEPSNPVAFTIPIAGQAPVNTTGLQIGQYLLSWVTTGTAASCTIKFDTGTTSSSFTDPATGTTAQTCTSSGSYAFTVAPSNFVRLNFSAFTATGSNNPTVQFFLTGSVGTPVGSSAVVLSCGNTGSGNQTCAFAAGTTRGPLVYDGESTLSANTATITFPIGYTSTTSYFCVANDVTTRANPVQMIPASGTTATITNTTGATDVIQWICVGN